MPDRPTVIVADDDPMILDLMTACVGELGATVERAATGSQALKLLQHQVPALMILDVYLHGMSGLKVCAAMRETRRWAAVPVLMMSGHGDRRTLLQSLEAGADDFVVKPFTAPVLQEKVRRLLETSRASAPGAAGEEVPP